jgi:hypothetical protein
LNRALPAYTLSLFSGYHEAFYPVAWVYQVGLLRTTYALPYWSALLVIIYG